MHVTSSVRVNVDFFRSVLIVSRGFHGCQGSSVAVERVSDGDLPMRLVVISLRERAEIDISDGNRIYTQQRQRYRR